MSPLEMEEVITGLLARLSESSATVLRLLRESKAARAREEKLEVKISKLEREVIHASVEADKMRDARDFARQEWSKQQTEIYRLRVAAGASR